MKRMLNSIFLMVVLAACAFGQAADKQAAKPAASMPSVDQVLDKYVQALGGKAALEKQTSRVAKGSFEIPAFGATGTLESYAKAPNKRVTIIDIPGFGTVYEGFDGKSGWAKDPQQGLRDQSGSELASAKIESEFHRDTKLKQLYPKIVVKGKDKVGDKEAYVLEATPTEGPTETWYFDVASGLLVRSDAERESPQGKVPVQVYVDSYKDFDGVKIPSVLRQVTPAFTLNIKIEDVKHNVQVDETKFNKPAN